jgi:hypothetical protein
MRFPEQTREGSAAHADAVRRLGAARDHQAQMTGVLEASRQTPDEADAATELSAANEDLAAREAWVAWIERGY